MDLSTRHKTMRPSAFFVFLIGALATTTAAEPSESFRDCDTCPTMVVIPAGSFVMGSNVEETTRENVPDHQAALERPQHDVTIAQPFALGATEVTITEFAAFVADTGHQAATCLIYNRDVGWTELPGSSWQHPPFPQEDNHPTICVNWGDASSYANWLSTKTGKSYRLPSESEWEYAARAGTTTARYWGDSVEKACAYANVADVNSHRQQFECDDGYRYTAPATFGIANAFGLYGMLGNVGEWAADCGQPNYATVAPSDGSAYVEGDCENHVGRGGSWWNDSYYIRAARRFNMSGGYYIVGFRVAMDLDE